MSAVTGRRLLVHWKPLFHNGLYSISTRKVNNEESASKRITNDQFLSSGKVRFKNENGTEIEVNTVWQDNMPSGSSVGTVVALHGSPGSHNDFKYVEDQLRPKNIRLVGLNFPGLGYTDPHPNLDYTNDERDNFITSMLDQLSIRDNIIWIGHSRGNENALRSAVRHATGSHGIVLVNTTGFRPHKGIRPNWVIKSAAWADRQGGVVRSLMNPITYRAYNFLGLKTGSPEGAARCVRTMDTFSLEKLRSVVEEFNQIQHLQAFICIGGRDFLIEEHITREFFEAFDDGTEIILPSSPDDESEAISFSLKHISNGQKTTAVCFKKDGHFMQKHRATLVAKVCEQMLMNKRVL